MAYPGSAGWPSEQTIDARRLLGGTINTIVYDKGAPVVQQTFAADSPQAKLVERWLLEHQESWTVNWSDYAPKRLVNCERFRLNFHDGHVIINYEVEAVSHRWAQLSRKLAPENIPAVFGKGGVHAMRGVKDQSKSPKAEIEKKSRREKRTL